MLNTTTNGIHYDWYNAPNKKVNVTLLPIEGVHTIPQVVDAKLELAIKRHIDKFKIEWQQLKQKQTVQSVGQSVK